MMVRILSIWIYGNRKKRVQKLEKEEVGRGTEEAQLQQEGDEDETSQKKKSDDLWASFLSDVGSRPKDSVPASQSGTIQGVSMEMEDGDVWRYILNQLQH